MYPRLTVDLHKIRGNVRTVAALCAEKGISVTAVTKGYCADPAIVKALLDAGITRLGDSRLENLKTIAHLPGEKWHLRLPQASEAEELVRYADASLVSEKATLEALAGAAVRQGKTHKVILMVELGDIREGILDRAELLDAARYAAGTAGLALYGLGTNLSCLSFVRPDREKMETLAQAAQAVAGAVGQPVELLSVGNSATINLLLAGGLPPGSGNLRLGESLLFGKERATYQYLEGTQADAFLLEAQIIELKDKPSLPWGEIGPDSYGRVPSFVDRGIRRRCICALGRQDVDIETMAAVDPGVEIIGASSDHLIADVSDSGIRYQAGDTITFRLGYMAMMRAFTSRYVERVYRNE